MPNSASSVFFSVIIPTRNRPELFKIALDSVLAQSFKEIEVIVVNDGTSDEFLPAYKAMENDYDERVNFISLIQRSRGHGHCFARNQGVDRARGQFICFLDDDDWWTDNNFLARAHENLVKENADFYFANQQAVLSDGTEIHNVWVEDLPDTLSATDPRKNQTIIEVSVKEALGAKGFPHQNCWAIKKSLYEHIDGMDENLRYEPDRDIYLRALDSATKILFDKTFVALHNVPDKNKSNNASTKTNIKQKLLFQLRTAEKGILFSQKEEIIDFCTQRKGYLLKRLVEVLVNEQNFKLANLYAREALGFSFTAKWWLYTKYLSIQGIIKS